MNNLIKVTSNLFNEVHVDFFKSSTDEIIMTAEQIGSALGYSDGRKAVLKIFERNVDVLSHYSDVVSLTATDGKDYETRIFSEKGIYRIAFLSKKPKAIEFQEWALEVIQTIRKTGMYIQTTETTTPDLLQKVNELETKLNSFVTLDSHEQRLLQKAMGRRIYTLIEEKEKRHLAFAELHREIRDRFGVPSYRDVAKLDFQKGLQYIGGWIPKKVAS